MKSNSHGQQRSQDQNKRLYSFGYPALCRVAERTETQILAGQLLRVEPISRRNTTVQTRLDRFPVS
jgi:hypothetical protein